MSVGAAGKAVEWEDEGRKSSWVSDTKRCSEKERRLASLIRSCYVRRDRRLDRAGMSQMLSMRYDEEVSDGSERD